MLLLISAIVILFVAFILYKVSGKFFSKNYWPFISSCYFVAYIPFFVYLVVFWTIAFLYPFLYLMIPVLFAHIALKIKNRGRKKSKMRLMEKIVVDSIYVMFR